MPENAMIIGIFVSTLPQNQARLMYYNVIHIRSASVQHDGQILTDLSGS